MVENNRRTCNVRERTVRKYSECNATPWLRQPDNSDVLSQIKISGDTDLQQKIRKVCLKYRDIFSNELPAAPAKIPEFTLDVQTEK